jgi:hypothetical protein
VLPDPGDPTVVPSTSVLPDALLDAPDVTLVVWPQDDALRRRLAAARRPRLLLIPSDQPPPLAADELEDWLRFPLDPEELANRAGALAERAREVAPRPVALRLDADGVLHSPDGWVAVPPREASVLGRLLEKAGQLVPRAELWNVAGPEGPRSDTRALDSVVKRLRRRIAPLGVTVHTVPGQGYLLDHVADPDASP